MKNPDDRSHGGALREGGGDQKAKENVAVIVISAGSTHKISSLNVPNTVRYTVFSAIKSNSLAGKVGVENAPIFGGRLDSPPQPGRVEFCSNCRPLYEILKRTLYLRRL